MIATGPSFGDIERARAALAGHVLATPIIASDSLAQRLGTPVCLKLEMLQPTGSFKIRGATNAVAALSPEQRRRGVVCASTGNHGRAVAHAAVKAGSKATVCLSELVPAAKVAGVEAAGGTVRRIGKSQDEAMHEVARLVREEGLVEIPPFDDPRVIAGQGTIGLEILEALPDVATVLIPLSGGGLAGGIALALKSVKPTVRVIGVSMDRGPAMQMSIAAGKPVEVEEYPSLADSLGGGIGLDNAYSLDLCRRLIDEVLLVSETEIYRGLRHLIRSERLIAEGGSAVGVAAIIAGKLGAAKGPVVLVISGRNGDPDQIARIAMGLPVEIGGSSIGGPG